MRRKMAGQETGVAWSPINDLARVGPGLLVGVEGEKEKVLLWLK
jgi:hypothetical protein